MTRRISWPMYAADPAAVAGFWSRLRRALSTTGIDDIPATLTVPDDLVAHWRDPALLLSQTCGFPFVTSLAGHVRYVATPCFDAPGCEGAYYRSAVVVRRDEQARSLAAMAGRRVAFNSRDSQSGYNGLRALVAPLAGGRRYFGAVIETGAHRRSIDAVLSGAVDLAAIDVVTLTLLADLVPAKIERLRVLTHTALMPGLPLITAANTTDTDLTRLQRALAAVCNGETAEAQRLRLKGMAVLPVENYDALLVQRDAARQAGYPELA